MCNSLRVSLYGKRGKDEGRKTNDDSSYATDKRNPKISLGGENGEVRKEIGKRGAFKQLSARKTHLQGKERNPPENGSVAHRAQRFY